MVHIGEEFLHETLLAHGSAQCVWLKGEPSYSCKCGDTLLQGERGQDELARALARHQAQVILAGPVSTVDVFLPDWDKERLDHVVTEAVLAYNPNADTGPDRLPYHCVNHLRHTYSTYERSQTTIDLIEVHRQIAEKFPHLADEASRQSANRRLHDEVFGTWAPRSLTKEEEAERYHDSVEALANINTGDMVVITKNGHTTVGRVISKGEAKAKVSIGLDAGFLETMAWGIELEALPT